MLQLDDEEKMKKKSLTPLMDRIDKERKMFMPSLEDAPTPSEFDLWLLEVAEKHGHDLLDDGWDDGGPDGDEYE